MDALKQTIAKFKIPLIIAAIVFAGLLGYSIFNAGESRDEGSVIRSQNQSIANSELGREIISTLNRLKGIDIDPDFFEEPSFTRLVDFSVDIQEQPVGKENPFKDEVDASANEELEGSEVFDEVIDEEINDTSQ